MALHKRDIWAKSVLFKLKENKLPEKTTNEQLII